MPYVILISSAVLAFGTFKNNGEITKIKNNLNNLNFEHLHL